MTPNTKTDDEGQEVIPRKTTNGFSLTIKCPPRGLSPVAVEIVLTYEELKAAIADLEADRTVPHLYSATCSCVDCSEPKHALEWREFRDNKLLWWVNRSLHLFGWAIVLEQRGDRIVGVYPQRVPYRGFPESSEEAGFAGLTRYLAGEATSLVRDIEEGAL